MVRFPARPVRAGAQGRDVEIEATWDGFDLLFTATVPGPSVGDPELTEDYRYDSLGRRIAKLNLSDDGFAGRRYIYDGWSVVEERLLSEEPIVPVAAEGVPTSTTDRLERIYVNGSGIDEPLLAAIDGDGDGDLDGAALPRNTPDGTDFEYYFLNNRQGSIMGLLDAADPSRVLEYTRYSAYGQPTILPIVDSGEAPGSVAGDGIEDTPDDLTDNDARSSGGASDMANPYLFNARRFDEETGLYYNRTRYYEPTQGRFSERSQIHGASGMSNLENSYSIKTDHHALTMPLRPTSATQIYEKNSFASSGSARTPSSCQNSRDWICPEPDTCYRTCLLALGLPTDCFKKCQFLTVNNPPAGLDWQHCGCHSNPVTTPSLPLLSPSPSSGISKHRPRKINGGTNKSQLSSSTTTCEQQNPVGEPYLGIEETLVMASCSFEGGTCYYREGSSVANCFPPSGMLYRSVWLTSSGCATAGGTWTILHGVAACRGMANPCE